MGNMHEQWRRGGESVRVIFKINPNSAPPAELAMLGTEVSEFFRSMFVGHVENRSDTKVVLPSSRPVERALKMLAMQKRSPWILSCLLEEHDTFYYAYWPVLEPISCREAEKLEPDRLFEDILLRLHLVEQYRHGDAVRFGSLARQIAGLEALLRERKSVSAWSRPFRWLFEWLLGMRHFACRTQEYVASLERRLDHFVGQQRRLAVVVDWQNFLKVVQAEAPRLPLEQCGLTSAVEAARWWRTAWPREAVEVVVVDYDSATTVDLHCLWEVFGYRYMRVDPRPGVKKPDDQVVREVALDLARRPALGIQDICLITGDGDFAPLCRTLRDEYGLRVFAAGFIGHISRRLAEAVPVMVLDHTVPLPSASFWEEAARTPTASSDPPQSVPPEEPLRSNRSPPKLQPRPAP